MRLVRELRGVARRRTPPQFWLIPIIYESITIQSQLHNTSLHPALAPSAQTPSTSAFIFSAIKACTDVTGCRVSR